MCVECTEHGYLFTTDKAVDFVLSCPCVQSLRGGFFVNKASRDLVCDWLARDSTAPWRTEQKTAVESGPAKRGLDPHREFGGCPLFG